MNRVGILYICTGDYTVFWPEFYNSSEQYFLKSSEVHYFVFTDAEYLEYHGENERIHLIHQEAYGWPYSTLMRFDIFLSARELLQECDYLFFFNANAQFVAPITEDAFLPRVDVGENLLFVQHPGFFNKKSYEFTYDRNPQCSAYIPYWKGNVYVCGGINGGLTQAFLSMCEYLSYRINEDLKNNIIPEWHDESQINHYILDRTDYRLLLPEYCYPEGWDIPFSRLVLIRDKRRYINIGQIRKNAPKTSIPYIYRITNIIAKFGAILISLFRK